MILKDLAFAEAALALPAPERAALAQLLMDSLENDPRPDDEIRNELRLRFQKLRAADDAGMTFEQVFDKAL